MGAIINGFRNLKARFSSQKIGTPTNFNKPMQGTLTPTVPFSSPVKKSAGFAASLHHVAGASGNPGGNPTT